jgi:hypothetical protein
LEQAISQVSSLSWPRTFDVEEPDSQDTEAPIRRRLIDQVKERIAMQRKEIAAVL